jgi:hypothetical protein
VPSRRTNWTRLVPPPVLIGHVSSRARQAEAAIDLQAECDRMQTQLEKMVASLPKCLAERFPHQGHLWRLAVVSEKVGTRRTPLPRTKWTRRVPHPVLIGHTASLTPY